MRDNCTYCITLQGQVRDAEINVRSPLLVTVAEAGPANTRLDLSTDQSGLVGLISYLHGLGFVLLSVYRTEK